MDTIAANRDLLYNKASVKRGLRTMLRPVKDHSRGKIAGISHTGLSDWEQQY